MKSLVRINLLILYSLFSLVSWASGANLLVNGSFELPDVPPGTASVNMVPSGWSAPGPLSPQMFDYPPAPWPSPQDLNQYVAIGASLFAHAEAPLSQSFTASAAGIYILSWYDNAAIGVGGAPYDVLVSGSDGATLFSLPIGSAGWNVRSLPMTLSAGSYEVLFKPRPGAGVTLLGNASLTSETPANSPPTAIAKILHDADLDGGDPEILIISVNGVDALATLDGTLSSDPDGDSLSYAWFESPHGESPIPIGTAAVLEVPLAIGAHTIYLQVSDGRGGFSPFPAPSVTVITIDEAIGYLIAAVERSSLRADWKRILIGLLNTDQELFAGRRHLRRLDRYDAGVEGLRIFQATVSLLADPRISIVSRELARQLNYLSEQIINNI